MVIAYFERRVSSARGTDSIAADIMRHVHARQHLGKIIVVCDNPVVMLSAARKQWLKLSRTIQKQRASTLNADKILKYTHAIARMQHMHFTMKKPLERPEADIYFLNPDNLTLVPGNCYSLYILDPMPSDTIDYVIGHLPQDSLIIDYVHDTSWESRGLAPKADLEKHVREQWRATMDFLKLHDIHPKQLRNGHETNIEAMDDALDTLLAVSQGFIDVANGFQRALELARPLKISIDTRQQYDTVILLAHRVQALSTNTYSQRFLESYNEDDTFFFYDRMRDYIMGSQETIASVVARHKAAGRDRLADALLSASFLQRTQGSLPKLGAL